MDSDERSRNVFFDVLRPGPVRVIVRVGDKQDWFASRPRGRAADLLNDLLVDLVLNAPEEYIAGRIIQIDRPRSEAAAIRDSQSMIRKALAANGVRPGPTPKAVPDHRPDAYLIQIADMVAGGLVAWGSRDRRITSFGEAVTVIE
jgi:hypothetical protein